MSKRSETFGRLLKGAINSIAAYEGKTAPAVEDELGAQIGVAGSTIQRYKAGYLPTEPRVVQILAEAAVRRGYLSRAWLVRFLQAARYHSPDALMGQLADALGPTAAPRDSTLPSGTLVFLFTDIEGSTTLWEQHPELMERALSRHDQILRQTIDAYGGHIFNTAGDAFHAVFTAAADALDAILAAQRALRAEAWGPAGPIQVRAALHVGAAQQRDGDYFGPPLNRVARLCSAGHGGQVLLSNAAYELVCDALPKGTELRDLGEHRLKDLDRPERIFQLVAPDLPSDFPPLRTLEIYTHNLPAQATALIGREREIAAVRDLLRRDDVRLVTLTGPGGTGKTRLALQVAAEMLDTFADGVYFVDLQPISDPDLVISTIAQTLKVKESGSQPLVARLRDYLRTKQLLLLLDNFEQVLAAAPLVGELLAAAPRLKALVTSRAVLHLYGEREFAVAPLALPDPTQLPPLERLTQYEAVRLFIERAQAVRPDFVVTGENAPAIAEICTRLDGLPLAIELAAARIKLFPPQALVTRLAAPLQVLTGGPRDLPARQQTLHGTIEWSYRLLEAGEQALFAQLGVFVGGFTLEAAQAVAHVAGERLLDVVDGVAALLDQSLLRQVGGPHGEPRFTMLETLRAYALEQAMLRGEVEALRHQHAAYYLALAEHAEPALKSAEQAIWLQRLEAEHENLRAALQWLIDRGTQEQALRLAGALWRFWRLRGYLSEGRRWLDAALAGEQTASLLDSEPALAAARARALTGSGILAHYQGDYTRATTLCAESLTLFRRLGDRPGIAAALHGLALIARSGGNYAAARAMYQESLAINREFGDIWGSASSLFYLGVVYMFDANYAEARPVLEESLALFKQAGDPEGHAGVLHVLGIVSWGEGDNRSAWSLTAEALTAFRNLGNRRMVASALSELGRVAASSGDVATARDLYEESLPLYREVGDRFFIVQALEGLADVAVRLKNPAWAARLLGAAHALREALGVPRAPIDAPGYERCVVAARAQLSAQAFASAWAVGQMMTPQEAVASEESPLPEQHGTPAIASPADPDALTARELEVLRLVAQGFTDAQVAERLIVSQRTVHAHLRSIYSKLDVTSRTAAVRYAVDRQLL